MDPNKVYCRNVEPSSAPASSVSSLAIACSGNTLHEYTTCDMNSNTAGFNCKQLISQGNSSKSIPNQRGTNGGSGFGNGINGGYCSSNSNAFGNYINIVPISTGTLQYHRRKLTPQEYQTRMCYNTTDYRCRDEYYAANGSTRLSASSPSSLLQSQSQNKPNNSLQTQQSVQIQHPQHLQHLSQHYHAACSPSSATNEDLDNCGRVVAATQTHHSESSGICDQTVAPTSGALGSSIAFQSHPLMYTVHRVVTTAQIQTSAGNTFASSSSVSSVVSALRNETDCIAESADSVNTECLVSSMGATNHPAAIREIGISGENNVLNCAITSASRASDLRSSPGTGTNCLSHHQKCSNTTEFLHHSVPRLSNINYSSNTSSSNSNSINGGGKPSASIPRPLQNVIPTCVYLMSRVAVHMEIEGTAQCPTQVMLAAALGCEELGIANKLLAQSIFGLWMTSTLLEIQLKSHHRPYVVRIAWQNLLEKFSHGNPIEKNFDEPMIMLKRNVFFSKRDEEKIKDHRILELLYEEAKFNVLSGRYIMEPVHSLMLGGIQARIELGPYNSHTHTVGFFRENQLRFLPQHVAKSTSWSWLPVSPKSSAEVKLLEQFKRVPQTATTRKLMRKYLEFCWALPFYGAAFFHGQVEQPLRGLLSFVNHRDVDVIVAINERGIFLIDPVECTLLLGLRYEDLSWDFAKPSLSEDTENQTCVFIQFDAVESGIQISKLMQIFSKQAAMIDALISHFAELTKQRKHDTNKSDQLHDELNIIQNNGSGVLSNKLSRLTLATFDEEGRCIGQMGSLSISY